MKKTILLSAALMAVLPSFAILEPATPESQGVSSEAILKFIDACEKLGGVHSFVLVRHGKTIAEGWWSPFLPDETHMLYSHSKSFTSTAVGFVVDEGKLDLDTRVVEVFPEYRPATACSHMDDLRIRDLLTMNVGAPNDHLYRGETAEGDWVKTFFTKKDFKLQPGTKFKYDSDATFMLAAIVERASGQKLMDFLKERLFSKIGIEKAWTTTSPQGIACGGWGMNMTTRELARFGQFYLQKGKWEGEQLLSTDWVSLATTRQTWSGWQKVGPTQLGAGSDWEQGYGFQFWRCRHNAFRADGASGQYTVVMPDQDAVISMTAGLGDMGRELENVWDFLLPAMQDRPLEENAEAQAKLRARLEGLKLPLIRGTAEGNAKVYGKTYRLAEPEKQSRIHIREIGLEREGDGWTLKYTGDCGQQTIPVGDRDRKRGTVKIEEGNAESLGALIGDRQPTAAQGGWVNPDEFKCRVYLTGTTHYLEFDFKFTDGGLSLTYYLWGMGGFNATCEGRIRQ